MKIKATRIIDADGHVRETDEEIIEYMSAGYRNRRDAMLYFPLTPHHGWHRSIPANDFRHQDFRVPDWREWVEQARRRRIRADRALSDPLHAYRPDRQSDPTPSSCAAPITIICTIDFLIHDRRFRGMALLPMQDPKAAVKELRRAVKKYGMVGGILPADGLQLPLGHQQYWPVYQEADRLGCALSIHSCNSLRDNDRYLVPNEAAALTHVIPQMRQFTNIMFSGVMNKLKKLRLGFLEAGCGWMPFLIEQDRGTSRTGRAGGAAGAAERTIGAQAALFSMRRGSDDQTRRRAARRRLLAVGLRLPPRSDPHRHAKARQRTLRAQRPEPGGEKENHLRQRQTVLPAVKINVEAFKSFNRFASFNRYAPFKPLEPPKTF